MKLKSFQDLLEKRFDKDEIAEIKRQAKLEAKILRVLQRIISETLKEYMEENKIGFNELVRRLHSNPTQIAKIQRGEANLTLSSLAHLFALIGKEPKDIFKDDIAKA